MHCKWSRMILNSLCCHVPEALYMKNHHDGTQISFWCYLLVLELLNETKNLVFVL
jgi:hypothetical protein